MRCRLGLISLLLSLWVPAQLSAATTTYDINFSVDGVYYNPAAGAFQSAFPAIGITGTIVTDGTIGALTDTSVLSWDLFFSTPAFSNARSQSSDANALFDPGTRGFLYARADGTLYLDGAQTEGFLGTVGYIGMGGLAQFAGAGNEFLGLLFLGLPEDGGASVYAYDTIRYQAWDIGTEAAAVPAPVPLPAGIVLLTSGLGGLIVLRRRQRPTPT